MKLPEWNNKLQCWDTYRAFHIGIGARSYYASEFIMFDTGEVICVISHPRPESRRVYSELNLELTSTTEATFKTPDGEPVPAAWLNQGGQQYVLVDLDTNRAVRLKDWSARQKPPVIVPERLKSVATAYIPGAGRDPVGEPFITQPPLRESLTKEEYEHVEGLRLSLVAAVALIADHPAKTPAGYWARYEPLKVETLLKAESILDLSDEEQRNLYRKSIKRKVITYDYLIKAN